MTVTPMIARRIFSIERDENSQRGIFGQEVIDPLTGKQQSLDLPEPPEEKDEDTETLKMFDEEA